MLENKNGRYKEYFDKIAPSLSSYRKNRSYYWQDIINYCNYYSHEDYSVLEIGCGTGNLINGLKARKKTGIDFSSKMLEQAKSNYPAINFIEMDAENLNINETFDLIIISNVIGFVEDVQKVFSELKKIAHPGTKIIVTYYNYFWEPFVKLAEGIGLKAKTPNQNWLSQADICNLLYISGFDVYKTTRRMLFPFYIPILSALLNKYLAHLPLLKSLNLNTYSFARPLPIDTEETAKNKFSISIVIPARNESGNIENAIQRLPVMGKSMEIIFIEGNSTDDTWQKIQEIAEKYKHSHNIKIGQQEGKGKGDAVRKGYSMATGDILMILDADLTVPPEDLPKFYEAIATRKGDFINGCRLIYPMEKNAMRFLNLLGNKFFSIMFTWLLDQSFKDTLCGTKVIFREDYLHLIKNRAYFGEFDPFGDYDLIFGAHKLNLKIVELPIRYQERTYGTTNISRFKHGILLLRMCLFAAKKIKFY